jgi:hypothetical protein
MSDAGRTEAAAQAMHDADPRGWCYVASIGLAAADQWDAEHGYARVGPFRAVEAQGEVLRKPGDPAWSAEFDRLHDVIAELRAQRDAALALCDEAAQNADSALDVLAFIWLVRSALGVQPEHSNNNQEGVDLDG